MAHPECRKLLGSLSEYIDGTSEARICTEIERHIGECERCRIVVDTLHKTVYLYQTASSQEEVPEEVRLRLYKRLEIEAPAEYSHASGKLRTQGVEPRAGERCPECQAFNLEYDGLLNLSCAGCGYTVNGGYT